VPHSLKTHVPGPMAGYDQEVLYDQKFSLADWQPGDGVDFQVPGVEPEVPMSEVPMENFDPSTLDIQQILGMVNNGGTNMEM